MGMMNPENTEPVVETTEAPDPGPEALAAERDRLAAEKAELQDLLLRRQADFENFKKRYERERAELFDAVAMESVRPLLEILDDFERALKSAPETDGPAREFIKGTELIHARLSEILAKMGVEPIKSEGEKFDPNVHHAVQKMASADHAEDTVLEEYQRGYRFKGKLLRPAMVKVSVNS